MAGAPEFTEADYRKSLPECPNHGHQKCTCMIHSSNIGYVAAGTPDSHSVRIVFRETRRYVTLNGMSEPVPIEQHIFVPGDMLDDFIKLLEGVREILNDQEHAKEITERMVSKMEHPAYGVLPHKKEATVEDIAQSLKDFLAEEEKLNGTED